MNGSWLAFQNACLPVRAQLRTIDRREYPAIASALPVTVEEPIALLAGVTFPGPFDEPLFQQVIVAAECCRRDDAVVVGDKAKDERIQFLDDSRLRRRLQLLQALINGGDVPPAGLLAGGD